MATVDIYIREKDGDREIRIPILPEKIKCKMGDTEFVTYSIMRKGDVSYPTGTGLATYSWESEFPGELRKSDPLIHGDWQEPSNYHNTLEDWKEKGTILTLLVTGYPINSDVNIKSYTATPSGAFGDMKYEITFQQNREIKITKQAESNTTTQTKRAADTSSTYTIKSGDTLWGISQKFYGAGSKWTTIYQANKDIIESTAKKYGKSSSDNGHWIYPGVSLKIPK